MSASFGWSHNRPSFGSAQKENDTRPLLIPNPDYQERSKDISAEVDASPHPGGDTLQTVLAADVTAEEDITPTDLRFQKFTTLLSASTVDLDALRTLSWSGVPASLRPQVWKLLSGYLPLNKERRTSALDRKRNEYRSFLPHFESVQNSLKSADRDEYEASTFHQIRIDVPRTAPTSALLQQQTVQSSLERILFSWAIRHPASGYVQGINDLCTPFFVVFLSEHLQRSDWPLENCIVSKEITEDQLLHVESDCFWCMSKFLSHIQENYTFAQSGIQKMVFKLEELINTIDAPLAKHLDSQGASFLQFSFRWMNCLLMREIPLHLIVRMWDTYLAEAEDFAAFHVYVCTAFLLYWGPQLMKLEFQDLMIFLQRLPTNKWTQRDIDELMSTAFTLKNRYPTKNNE